MARCQRLIDGPDGARSQCAGDGRWHPVLKVPARHHEHAPAKVVLGLFVCDEHKRSSTLEDYLTDEAWERISKGIVAAGRLEPERKLTTLSWEPVDSKDSRVLHAMGGS